MHSRCCHCGQVQHSAVHEICVKTPPVSSPHLICAGNIPKPVNLTHIETHETLVFCLCESATWALFNFQTDKLGVAQLFYQICSSSLKKDKYLLDWITGMLVFLLFLGMFPPFETHHCRDYTRTNWENLNVKWEYVIIAFSCRQCLRCVCIKWLRLCFHRWSNPLNWRRK